MGNQDSKLRGFVSLPAENFPSMKLENSDKGWTNPGFSGKHTRSYDAQDRLAGNGFSNLPSSTHLASDDAVFLPVYKRDPEINESHFSVISLIAKGAFGDVLQVRHIKDDTIYAMKVMQKKRLIADGAVQQSKDEATIQDAVGYHPLVVKPFWFFQNSENVFILMEYIPCGELFTAWKNAGRFSESVVRIYVAELATVVDFLHMSGIIFRDLKMENILLDSRGHLHVTDFGLAKRLKRGQRTNTICGTLQYIAPEVVYAKPYGHASDWWSLGILTYVLLVGRFPVSGAKDHFELAKQMTGVRYELPSNYDFSPAVRHLVASFLQMSPESRLSKLEDVQRHKFFNGFNFDGVVKMEVKPQKQNNVDSSPESKNHVQNQKVHSLSNLQWKEPVASLHGLYV